MRAGETTATTRLGTGRAVPWAVLGLWIAALVLVGPLAAKLADVQHDKVTDYLPASADSTQVAKIEERLPGGETTELVLVYHRDGGLSAADRETAAGQVAEITRQHELTGGAPQGIASKDGTTLMYPVAGNEPGADEEQRDKLVDDVREVARGDGGLSVEVGGTGALATDSGAVYDSLGGPLLYTTVAVLLCLLAADLNSSRGMGPLGTVGVLCALIAMTTLLPAVLVLVGRRVFRPLVPAFGSTPKRRRSLFSAMGGSAGRRPYSRAVPSCSAPSPSARSPCRDRSSRRTPSSTSRSPSSRWRPSPRHIPGRAAGPST